MSQAVMYVAYLDGFDYIFPDGVVPEVGSQHFINGVYYTVLCVHEDWTVEMEESPVAPIPLELDPLEVPVPAGRLRTCQKQAQQSARSFPVIIGEQLVFAVAA